MEKNKFDIFVAQNLPKALKKATLESLGDRKEYIGSSDIAGCLRKAYLDKTNDIEHDLATLIRFQRGHIAEGIVEAMLDGLNPTKQLEKEIIHNDIPLKCHIDFALEKKDEIVIIEAKSVSTSVENPYSSWLLQVSYQLEILSRHTNKKVRAYIVAINLNTGWFKSFEVNYNEAFSNIALEKAYKLTVALKEQIEPECEEQLYCSTCPHKGNCPAMVKKISQINLNGDLLNVANRLIELNKFKKELDKEIEEKKAIIEEYMRSTESKKLNVGENFISLSNDTTSISFDTKAFEKNEPELYANLFQKYQKSSSRKGYISIK
ncbi:Dna2/Cas4 domain-containing protein [Campylobacter insulaenigrae]|uniref:Dna2/Cas4 domain-containing protein n=1 Tax=Campylobacter insulaenigrae TaxID=260714 RepID=UPI0021520E9B|nr:Dna2/Cas4 domain-containing protein [Campylobacter insulaenigrae]MCR6574329.1 Dna2/Cas4 domain-containing protein [Campylobacter insulaenigrae]